MEIIRESEMVMEIISQVVLFMMVVVSMSKREKMMDEIVEAIGIAENVCLVIMNGFQRRDDSVNALPSMALNNGRSVIIVIFALVLIGKLK